MERPDFEYGIDYFKQFGAERIKNTTSDDTLLCVDVRTAHYFFYLTVEPSREKTHNVDYA